MTREGIILSHALYYAPAGLNIAASVTWAAADLFVFQRFDGSWNKTKTETLTLYPSGNLPPCWNGICPTSIRRAHEWTGSNSYPMKRALRK